jgi:hypothetical protein
MLNITYADKDAGLASTIQKDLSSSSLTLENAYLLVLLSANTLQDSSVREDIQSALKTKTRVVPVLVESEAPIPPELASVKKIDLTGGYHAARVTGALKRMDIGEDRITRNWRLLIGMMVIVSIAFVASVWGITQGLIRFPEEEYATENARTDITLQAVVGPTLESIRPRTTEDAGNFRVTLDAMPQRMRDLAIETATAQVLYAPTRTPQP